MKPSEKAIRAVTDGMDKGWFDAKKSLESAYAIDVDPLLEQKDKEIFSVGKYAARLEQEIARLKANAQILYEKHFRGVSCSSTANLRVEGRN